MGIKLKLGMVLTGIMVVLLTGCGDSNVFSGDDSTPEAKLDRAVMSLDSGDWDNSIALLGDLDQNDPEVQKYLASAYVGRAGFDTLELITTIAKYEEENNDGEVLFDSVTDIFADKNSEIHAADAKITDLETAIDILADPIQAQLAKAATLRSERISNSRLVQRATTAAVQTALIIVRMLDENIIIYRETLRGLSDDEIESRITADEFDERQFQLERNLRIIRAGIAVLPGEKNELKAQFNKFLAKIGFDDDSLTRDDLVTYLKNVL